MKKIDLLAQGDAAMRLHMDAPLDAMPYHAMAEAVPKSYSDPYRTARGLYRLEGEARAAAAEYEGRFPPMGYCTDTEVRPVAGGWEVTGRRLACCD